MRTEKLVAKVSNQLDSDETIQAAAKVIDDKAARRSIIAISGAAAGGNIGIAAATAMASPQDFSEATGGAEHALMVVTDRRVAFFPLSLLGRPQELSASVPLDAIESANLGEVSLVGQTLPEIQLFLSSGEQFGFSVGKTHREDAQKVVAEINP